MVVSEGSTTVKDVLAEAVRPADTGALIEMYRETDRQWSGYTPAEAAAAAGVRGAITDELEARFPGVIDAWADALDEGLPEPDLMVLFEQAAEKVAV